MKLLREPLVHFMFIGAVIYALYGAFAEPVVEETDKTIVVTAGEIRVDANQLAETLEPTADGEGV